ncbi:LuxR C-terminal-related transcriptional regulator [Streptomyces sp. CoH27]|uniref:LuxR C-terminal-related transcriptional regulator n=1 Tax=Streptomyces sp. CoH27 TaxID=2875763 RepID=UPI0035A8252F
MVRFPAWTVEASSAKAAASRLGVSINTVGTQARSIFAKLGVRSRVQLANHLHEEGVVGPGEQPEAH